MEEARDLYERAQLLAPSDVGMVIGAGNVDRLTGNFEGALRQLESALTMAGTPEERAQAYSALETYYTTRGQIGMALEYMERRLDEASASQPGFMVVQRRLLEVGLYAEAGRQAEAFAIVEEARTQLPPPFDGMAPIGEMEIYQVLEDAEALEGTFPGVEAFIESIQYEILRPALAIARGFAHELRGEYKEAIERYEEARRLQPARTSNSMRLGRCYRELGEYDQAVALLRESLAAGPFGPGTNYELALTYEAMGRMDEARTHVERALEVWADADPDYKWARRARAAAGRLGR
jgi:tetratricopeptide (TPR) repeat protein